MIALEVFMTLFLGQFEWVLVEIRNAEDSPKNKPLVEQTERKFFTYRREWTKLKNRRNGWTNENDRNESTKIDEEETVKKIMFPSVEKSNLPQNWLVLSWYSFFFFFTNFLCRASCCYCSELFATAGTQKVHNKIYTHTRAHTKYLFGRCEIFFSFFLIFAFIRVGEFQ